MGHIKPAMAWRRSGKLKGTCFCFAKELFAGKLHGPDLDFPRSALGGRRQWDGCLLGRGWAAEDIVDESVCGRGC